MAGFGDVGAGCACGAPSRTGVLAVGSVMVDRLCRVPRLPASGEGVVIESSQVSVGGCALNSANAVRQLGGAVRLFVPLGEGPNAGFARSQLEALGFGGQRMPGAARAVCGAPVPDCGEALCFVEPDGQRTMVTLPGIERSFEAAWFDLLDEAELAGIRAGFASGYELEPPGGDAIIGFFEEHPAIEFWYAPGPRILGMGEAKTVRINALRPVWHLNDQEARAYTGCETVGEAGRAIALACGNAAIITEGAAGSHVFVLEEGGEAAAAQVAESAACGEDARRESDVHAAERGGGAPARTADGGTAPDGAAGMSLGAPAQFDGGRVRVRHMFVPTEPVPVVDTVGAGDAHLGVLCAARCAGRTWEDALHLANVVAGAVCRTAGATLSDEAFARLGVRL